MVVWVIVHKFPGIGLDIWETDIEELHFWIKGAVKIKGWTAHGEEIING